MIGANEQCRSVFVVFVRPPRWTDAQIASLFPVMISLIIQKKHQNQGAGTYLIGAVEEEVKSRGLTQLYVAVDQENTGARRLYERLGFEAIPLEPYRSTWSWTDSEGVEHEEVEWLTDMVKKLA